MNGLQEKAENKEKIKGGRNGIKEKMKHEDEERMTLAQCPMFVYLSN
jgi:hypothetical protein